MTQRSATAARTADDASHDLLQLAGAISLYNAQFRVSLGIGASDFEALVSLHTNGGSSLSGLADRLALSRAAVTSLADRLEERGLAVRRKDPYDRRGIQLDVTDEFVRAAQEWSHALAARIGWNGSTPETWANGRTVMEELRGAMLAEAAGLRAANERRALEAD